ncbi:hypothetical protein CTAYLR_010661 [Chrysophaeum taylorii]|uniref:Cation efflux protein transmembrane domain-containing protein n=1 Tax=Chrysophaeum taylorii TaxID=2483200 RepID=A0AAD7XF12_9STRA|nr:hypothetical protein CTAYLR_010661 [Chrysophaeum taylorii]
MELLYAFISNSLALLGDASAMLVDACTYLGNFIAIRQAKKDGSSWLTTAGPCLSAIALTGVMIYVLYDAIDELLSSGGGGVKLRIVLIFGLSNLLLDVVNLVLFFAFPEAFKAILTFTDPEVLEKEGGLNVRSALTHVLADTYRSIAVVASASISMIDKNISSSKSDAVAAMAVELPILVMCIQMLMAVANRVFADESKPTAFLDEPHTPGGVRTEKPAESDAAAVV